MHYVLPTEQGHSAVFSQVKDDLSELDAMNWGDKKVQTSSCSAGSSTVVSFSETYSFVVAKPAAMDAVSAVCWQCAPTL